MSFSLELHESKNLCTAEADELKAFLTHHSVDELTDISHQLFLHVTGPVATSLSNVVVKLVRESCDDTKDIPFGIPDGFLLAHMLTSMVDYMHHVYEDQGGSKALPVYLLSLILSLSNVDEEDVLLPFALKRVKEAEKENASKIIVEGILAGMKRH